MNAELGEQGRASTPGGPAAPPLPYLPGRCPTPQHPQAARGQRLVDIALGSTAPIGAVALWLRNGMCGGPPSLGTCAPQLFIIASYLSVLLLALLRPRGWRAYRVAVIVVFKLGCGVMRPLHHPHHCLFQPPPAKMFHWMFDVFVGEGS